MKNIALKTLLILIYLSFSPTITHAQEASSQAASGNSAPIKFTSPITSVDDENLKEIVERIARVRPVIDLNQISSLFFTPSEQSLVAEARLGLTTRAPTDYELRQAEEGNVPRGPRELSLGGIVYISASDWTIWLNGKKVTPKRLPPEVLDIKVRKNDIKLKWFDAYTNQIFPIKLRTHQRFNIDTRIFLPGDAPDAVLGNY